MKLKIISAAVLSLIMTNVMAGTKTIDFYSTNGTNRYIVESKIKDIGVAVDKNSILIPDANADAYVTVNSENPYYLKLIQSDLNLNQILENNKGREIVHNGKKIKVLGMQGEYVLADNGESISLIPLKDFSIPKSFVNDTQKGLKAVFKKNISGDDNLYYSQPERNLRYTNSYQAVLKGDKINIAHYLNITNSSLKTFDDVKLNFYLSETMIDRGYAGVMNMSMKMAAPVAANVSRERMNEPSFESENVENLKSISIKEPVTIYPNFNKIKYVEKDLSVDQYARLNIEKKYDFYLDLNGINKNDYKMIGIKGSVLNNRYLEQLNNLSKGLVGDNLYIENIIDIKLDKDTIIPSGKFDIYAKNNGRDTLVVSTNVPYKENGSLEIVKNRNNSLKIKDVIFNDLNADKAIKELSVNQRLEVYVKSIVIENVGKEDYNIKVLGKTYKIKANSKITINQ